MDRLTRLYSFLKTASAHARVIRLGIVGIFLLCLQVSPLYPAIILETATTDVVIDIQPIADQRGQSRTLLPICDLSLHAKHRGYGRLKFDHTPLSRGNQMISYLLEDEQERVFDRTYSFAYQVNGASHELVRMGHLYARLLQPLIQNEGLYSSTITIHFILEQ